MASIKKFHVASCSGSACGCLWELDYRPLGLYGPRRRVRFKTRKQAERFLVDTAHRASQGTYVNPAKAPRFAELAEDWFRSMTDRRPSHVASLRTRIDKHLLPVFGPKRMDTIAVAELEKLRDDLRTQNYAATTINQILRIASCIFRLAVKRSQCSSNPLDRVDRARKAAREIKADDGSDEALSPESILDPAEVRRLLDAAHPGLDRTILSVAFITGARQGELLALRWTDLELPITGQGRMYIRRSLQWAHLKGEAIRPRFYPPKTKAGLRAIALPADLVVALKRWKLQCRPPTSRWYFRQRMDDRCAGITSCGLGCTQPLAVRGCGAGHRGPASTRPQQSSDHAGHLQSLAWERRKRRGGRRTRQGSDGNCRYRFRNTGKVGSKWAL